MLRVCEKNCRGSGVQTLCTLSLSITNESLEIQFTILAECAVVDILHTSSIEPMKMSRHVRARQLGQGYNRTSSVGRAIVQFACRHVYHR